MQERAKKTRDAILNAAVKMFARDGFHGTKIDAVATAAQVNKQRIYAYFGNKAKLFEAAMRNVFEKVNDEDRQLEFIGEDQLDTLTEKLLRHNLEVHRRHPELHRMIGWANLELSGPPEWLSNVKEKSFIRLREHYQLGQARGIFSPEVSFEVYIFTLLALTYFHTANRITASQTISHSLFTDSGTERLLREAAALLQPKPHQ